MHSLKNISICILATTIILCSCLMFNGCSSKAVKSAKDYISAGMYSEAIELLKLEIEEIQKMLKHNTFWDLLIYYWIRNMKLTFIFIVQNF